MRTALCRCDDDTQQLGGRTAVSAVQGLLNRHCEGMAMRTITQTMTMTRMSLPQLTRAADVTGSAVAGSVGYTARQGLPRTQLRGLAIPAGTAVWYANRQCASVVAIALHAL